MVVDQPEPGAKLIIRHLEKRFTWRNARVTKRLELDDALNMEEELPDGEAGDADGELDNDQLVMAKRVAAAQPGRAIRVDDEIERIIARDNLERPILPPARLPELPTTQRAGLSGLNAHLPQFRRYIESSDEDEPVHPVCPPRRPHLELEDNDYEQESDAEQDPPRRRK